MVYNIIMVYKVDFSGILKEQSNGLTQQKFTMTEYIFIITDYSTPE